MRGYLTSIGDNYSKLKGKTMKYPSQKGFILVSQQPSFTDTYNPVWNSSQWIDNYNRAFPFANVKLAQDCANEIEGHYNGAQVTIQPFYPD